MHPDNSTMTTETKRKKKKCLDSVTENSEVCTLLAHLFYYFCSLLNFPFIFNWLLRKVSHPQIPQDSDLSKGSEKRGKLGPQRRGPQGTGPGGVATGLRVGKVPSQVRCKRGEQWAAAASWGWLPHPAGPWCRQLSPGTQKTIGWHLLHHFKGEHFLKSGIEAQSCSWPSHPERRTGSVFLLQQENF